MTDKEARAVLWQKAKAAGRPSASRRYRRKAKLKLRYGDRLREAIADTREKLDLLIELKTAEEQRFVTGGE